jgi:hypothetical protein
LNGSGAAPCWDWIVPVGMWPDAAASAAEMMIAHFVMVPSACVIITEHPADVLDEILFIK